MQFKKTRNGGTHVILDNGFTVSYVPIEKPVPMPKRRCPVYEVAILNFKNQHVVHQYSKEVLGIEHCDTYLTQMYDEDILSAIQWAATQKTLFY